MKQRREYTLYLLFQSIFRKVLTSFIRVLSRNCEKGDFTDFRRGDQYKGRCIAFYVALLLPSDLSVFDGQCIFRWFLMANISLLKIRQFNKFLYRFEVSCMQQDAFQKQIRVFMRQKASNDVNKGFSKKGRIYIGQGNLNYSYICILRICENATTYETAFDQRLIGI